MLRRNSGTYSRMPREVPHWSQMKVFWSRFRTSYSYTFFSLAGNNTKITIAEYPEKPQSHRALHSPNQSRGTVESSILERLPCKPPCAAITGIVQIKTKWRTQNDQHSADRTNTDIRFPEDPAQFHLDYPLFAVHVCITGNEGRTPAADTRVVGRLQNSVWVASVSLWIGE